MKAYLRGLADEFGESTNAIRLELNHLEEAGLLCAESKGNKKVYQANPRHPLFGDIRSLVLKHSGITQVIEGVVERVGENIDMDYFNSLVKKAEDLIKRKIHCTIIFPEKETDYFTSEEKRLLIWKK